MRAVVTAKITHLAGYFSAGVFKYRVHPEPETNSPDAKATVRRAIPKEIFTINSDAEE